MIYVSNHGGRQLDHGAGSIDVLPEIVAAAAGRAEIIVDGGFCRGTDVLKALALGADAVAVGRLYGFGLAAAGRDGVLRVLELLHDELERAMGLSGVNTLSELNPSYVRAGAVDPAAARAQRIPVHRRSRRLLLMSDMLESQRVRQEIRAGRITGTSRGLAHGFVQCNLAILPKEYAFDFLLYCQRNQRACPVLEVTDPGSPVPKKLAPARRPAHRLRALRDLSRRRAHRGPHRYHANCGATTS